MTTPSPYLYLRGLRAVAHTVFNVQDGQKAYRDPQFGNLQAYASGQQVKRNILEAVLLALGEAAAPLIFNWQATSSKAKGGKANQDGTKSPDSVKFEQKEAWAPCNPSYIDQLLGGYMRVDKTPGIKRRSPLSVSALHPLHPLLGGLERELENLSLDRRNQSQHQVVVRDQDGQAMSEAAVAELLELADRELPQSVWVPEQKRATGLFVYDVAVDLRTLLCVNTSLTDPQLAPGMEQQLLDKGWTRTLNHFGPALLLPAAERERVLPALADALLGWRITTNQARTFSLQETLAVAVSPRADELAGAIRGKLYGEEDERPRARPVLDPTAGAELYVTLAAEGHVRGAEGSAKALEQARESILGHLRTYEQQLQG